MNNEPIDYPPLKAGGIIENNEPVAWMVNDKPYQDIFEAEHYSKFTNNPMIPLYTHPHSDKSVKAKTLTLTPDEIFDIWDEHTDYDGNFISDIDTFVLAILRKAQEK